jgi:adenylate cyclase
MPSLNFKALSKTVRHQLIAGVLCAGFLAFAAWHLWRTDSPLTFGQRLQNESYDILHQVRLKLNPKANQKIDEIILVYMDDESHEQLKQPYNTSWDRALYARLLDKLTADRARVAALDIIFSDRHPLKPEGDLVFAEAIKRNGRVVLAADRVKDPAGDYKFFRAHDLFEKSAAKPLGMAQVFPDQDLIVRKHFHVSPEEPESEISSLSWEAAALAGVPLAQSLTNRVVDRMISYYGPPLTLPSLSFFQALEAPTGYFSNKAVFVGAMLTTYFSGQRKDEYFSPFTRGTQFMPGVDIQATQYLNLVRGDWVRMPSWRLLQALLIGCGLVLGFGLIFLRPYQALLIGVALAAAITALAHHLFFAYRLYSPWLIVVAVEIPIAALWSWGFNSFRLFVQNRLLDQSLSAYVSPARVKELLRQQDKLKPGAEKQELSILFSDIAGFTSISEGMDSDDLARIMNAYFEGAVARIHETDGTVIKFIGDSIFAVWNAPLPQPDHHYRAARGGLLLSRAVDDFIKTTGKELLTRIGLHAGVANVGNFGSAKRFDYTAIGESINLASRMEGLNKHLGTTVLATSEIQSVVGDKLLWRFLGKFRLKGFDKAVAVHELLGEPDQAESTRMWREVFAAALAAFQQADFTAAKAGFARVQELRGKDGPSAYYLQYLEERPQPPGPGWKGEIEMKEK